MNPEHIERLRKCKQENLKEKYDKKNIVVKGLPKEFDDTALFNLFRPFGEITSAKCVVKGLFKEKKVNDEVIDKIYLYECTGMGFVLFKTEKAANNVSF